MKESRSGMRNPLEWIPLLAVSASALCMLSFVAIDFVGKWRLYRTGRDGVLLTELGERKAPMNGAGGG